MTPPRRALTTRPSVRSWFEKPVPRRGIELGDSTPLLGTGKEKLAPIVVGGVLTTVAVAGVFVAAGLPAKADPHKMVVMQPAPLPTITRAIHTPTPSPSETSTPQPTETTGTPTSETTSVPVTVSTYTPRVGPSTSAVEEPIPVAPAPAVNAESGTLVVAGNDAITVATVSGNGNLPMTFTRHSGSAAPNLPTYVSSICNGVSVWSGAFNTTGQDFKSVPYSGQCSIKVKVAQPSSKWNGSWSAVLVSVGSPVETGGSGVVVKAPWTSAPVASSGSFYLDVPNGSTGTLTVKGTACSSSGGTNDATITQGCSGYVQNGVGSSFTVMASDSNGVLAQTSYSISANTHHDMVVLPVTRSTVGGITVVVTWTGGSAVLVHGPGSGFVGTR